MSPQYVRPSHLAPLVEKLERIARGETVRVVVHTPPRHAKTETLLHAIPWLLQQHPDWTMGYASYSKDIAQSKSYKALALAKKAGIPLVREAVTEWRTAEGGGCLAKGIGEGLTGQGIDVGIVDDPVKDRVAAESAVIRNKTRDWFNDVFFTRRNPGQRPRSIIVNMARWHPDDLAGWLIKEKGWEYIRLPAIDDNGTALWPEMWPVAEMEATREQLGPYSFESLFQGNPRPRGGAVFGDPWVFTEWPVAYKVAFGLDLAYSKKTSADWSVLVVMAKQAGYYYVLDVVRRQMRAPEFTNVVKEYLTKYTSARVRWYGSGMETEGVASFMRPLLPRLEALGATSDKFIRAQKYSAAWNAGKVLLPEDTARHPWVQAFVDEHVNFTGVDDDHDDTVDAAVAAYDVLAAMPEGGSSGLLAGVSRRL